MISKILNGLKKTKKITNKPMIERTIFEKMNQEKGLISNKAARQRLRRKAQDVSLEGQGRQMIRYWNKANPKKKAIIASSFIAPKAALFSGGYFLNNNDNEEE